ncbi:MAG: TolC family protein, partial [Brachymonas sp.]|nr:TolC family protein [Brachymonas sp.]
NTVARNQNDAVQLARARFRNGLGNDFPVLEAEQTWLKAQSELMESNARLKTALVAVYKAVGGGVSEASGSKPDTVDTP